MSEPNTPAHDIPTVTATHDITTSPIGADTTAEPIEQFQQTDLDPSIPFEDPFVGKARPATIPRAGYRGAIRVKTEARRYLAASSYALAKSTQHDLGRRYNKMDADYDFLYRLGKVSTVNPNNMTSTDVHNYLRYRMSLGLSGSEIIHAQAALHNLLAYVGNEEAYLEAMNRHSSLKVSKNSERYPSIDPHDCQMLFAKAMTIDEADWFNMVRYGIVVFAVCTGMRAKELRLCDVDCISRVGDTFHVKVLHPKGEHKYAKPRDVVIDPEGIPFIKRYFKARQAHIAKLGFRSTAVFVGSKIADDHLAGNTVRSYADYVSKDLGANFDLRSCRRTYGQRLIDRGVDINTVSKMMGHKSTVTTERYYCSMDQQQAIEKVTRAFERKPQMDYHEQSHQMPRGMFDDWEEGAEEQRSPTETLRVASNRLRNPHPCGVEKCLYGVFSGTRHEGIWVKGMAWRGGFEPSGRIAT